MKNTKKLISVLLALVFVTIIVYGCGNKDNDISESNNVDSSATAQAPSQAPSQAPTQPSPQPPISSPVIPEAPVENANLADHIDIILEASLTIVNPYMLAGTGGAPQKGSYLIHDRLLQQIEPGVPGPMLATEWKTDDYQTFVFTLRDDVYFHNGDHFTAEDIVWNIEISEEFPSSNAYSRWIAVSSVKALDTYVVEIVLNEPHVDFFLDVTDYATAICNKRAYMENPDDPTWAHIGTGPYMVTEFESNDFITLERFDGFWGDPQPTRSLTLWSIPEMTTRMVMMQTGEAQVCFSMTPEDLDALDASADYNVFKVLLNEPTWIGFNNQGDSIMMDPNFRLAVAHAINVSDISTVAMGNWGQPAWDGNIWGPESQSRLEGLPQREYNPALAMEYLAKSVYNGETLEILTAAASNIRASETVQLQLFDVGINTNIETMEMSGFLEALNYNPNSTVQMHVFSGPMSTGALYTLRGAYYPGMGTNRLNLNNDYLTGIIDQLSVARNLSDREDLIHKAQQFFWDDLSAIALYWRVSGIPTVNGVGGMSLTSDPFNHSMRGIYWNLDEASANLRP